MSKADAALMKLVFRVGRIGCSLIVERLIEVVEIEPGDLDLTQADPVTAKLGEFSYRGEILPVVDLGAVFGLKSPSDPSSMTMLIVAGEDAPWGALVEKVIGVYPSTMFTTVELPLALRCRGLKVYSELDLWQGEPLVCMEPFNVDRLRNAGCL